MAVLERSELQASSLADLHAIADQLGLDGFRRLRKADLINTILGDDGGSQPDQTGAETAAVASKDSERDEPEGSEKGEEEPSGNGRPKRRGRRSSGRSRRSAAAKDEDDAEKPAS